jgi:hypothetical protein
MDKVRNGTLRGDTNLCWTCRHATIREDSNGTTYVHCSAFDRFITTRTVKCTDYKDKAEIPLYELDKLAWVYIPRVGFKKYSQMTAKQIKEHGS